MQYNEHIKINNEYVCIMVYIYRIIFKQRVLFFIYIYIYIIYIIHIIIISSSICVISIY